VLTAASRNHPSTDPAYGSQLAPFIPDSPRGAASTEPPAVAACLDIFSRRFGGVAESLEKLVAARRGPHPAEPVGDFRKINDLIAGVIRSV
jgi:hypothetical protein